jgi:thiol:disulfide interchange protein DsbD
MMIRVLLFLLVSASLALRASEPISVPYSGASATVKQPHVTAELIPETSVFDKGKPFDIILHLHSDPGWHTYWINPGDAGLATMIKWTLPEGFTAGPIQWPTPEKHNMGPLVTYGYEGDVYLITTITPPSPSFPFADKGFEIKAKASWLVCQEECIPGKGDFSVTLYPQQLRPVVNTKFFDEARARLPIENKDWNVCGVYEKLPFQDGEKPALNIIFKNKVERPDPNFGSLQFFPEQPNVLDPQGPFARILRTPVDPDIFFRLWLALIANGDKPDHISGVLVSDISLVEETTAIGDRRAVHISEFPVTSGVAAATGVPVPGGGSGASTANAGDGHRPPLQGETAPSRGLATATEGIVAAAQPWLIGVLGAAFIGGLILNLMPCVLPVLSLKVFSLMRHAEGDPRGAWKQGAAFTAGVVLSFWLLAGVLLALRAAGNHLGWGFQMQSPGFVLALIFIFFLLGLNLFGVFELGTSLVGLDAKVTGKSHGLTSSFLNGALATLAATPCTAPFMGSALGFAAQQSAFISMLIFTFLAIGMAAPYLLLTIFPGALKFVPKPGAWMEAFKQFMGFLLMATVIFLLYVFGALVGEEQVFWLLAALLLASVAAWIYGRWCGPLRTTSVRLVGYVLAIAGLGYAVYFGFTLASYVPQVDTPGYNPTGGQFDPETSARPPLKNWQPWSQDAVKQALAQGHPVFVDFTAAWCLSCKVNERVALDVQSVRYAFVEKNVILFKADWTHSDPEISKALQQYNRDGVPLYLLYSPKQPDQPQILPEVLTPGIVLEALGKI